jgi:hypothetical protein
MIQVLSNAHTSRKLYPPVGLQVHSDIASVSLVPLHQQLVGASRVLCIVEVLHSGIAGASHLECKHHMSLSHALQTSPDTSTSNTCWDACITNRARQVSTRHLVHTCCRQAQTQVQATQSAPAANRICERRSSSKGRQCIDWIIQSDMI